MSSLIQKLCAAVSEGDVERIQFMMQGYRVYVEILEVLFFLSLRSLMKNSASSIQGQTREYLSG